MTSQGNTSEVFLAACPGPVYLMGFMGSGKTTLGRALAARFDGACYVDLDEEVERSAGMSVREIFSSRGESCFRELEREALRRFAGERGLIVGCGGGTPCQPGNMELMNSTGLTVLLRASDEVLLRRLLEAQAQRPLLNGMDPAALAEFVRTEQLRREPFYGQATLEFPSDLLESEEEVSASCEAFARLVSGYLRDVRQKSRIKAETT